MTDEASDVLPDPIREYYESKLTALELQGALYEISNCAQIASFAMREDDQVESSGKLVAVQNVIERIGGIAHALAGGCTVTTLCSAYILKEGGAS